MFHFLFFFSFFSFNFNFNFYFYFWFLSLFLFPYQGTGYSDIAIKLRRKYFMTNPRMFTTVDRPSHPCQRPSTAALGGERNQKGNLFILLLIYLFVYFYALVFLFFLHCVLLFYTIFTNHTAVSQFYFCIFVHIFTFKFALL